VMRSQTHPSDRKMTTFTTLRGGSRGLQAW
jgi:hypothetical protein